MDHELLLRAREDGKHSVTLPDTPLVSEMLSQFLDYLRVEENSSAGTVIRYERHMQRFLKEVGDCPVGAIDGDLISLYKRRLLDACLSPATIAAIMSGMRSFLRYAGRFRGLPVYDPEKVRRPKIPKRDVEYLSKEETVRFLRAIPMHTLVGLRDRALAEILCATGMRISEALSLRRDQVDWESREVRIIGKGNKQRKVYFTETALAWLRQYLEKRYDDSPVLFTAHGDPSTPLKAQGTWKRFRRYATLAGIGKRVYPHMLRHTMATTLLANGCPIGHIRVMLGHEHLATTCKYYLGVMSDSEAKAAHAKYLWYDLDVGEETSGKSPERENIKT